MKKMGGPNEIYASSACPDCFGTGKEPQPMKCLNCDEKLGMACEDCGGKGKVSCSVCWGGGRQDSSFCSICEDRFVVDCYGCSATSMTEICPNCGDDGKVGRDMMPCRRCGGAGKL